MRHTFNNFKEKIKSMNKKEKEDFLKELHSTLMEEKTKCKRGVYSQNVRVLRKQIAMLKTELHVKGFHYHPR